MRTTINRVIFEQEIREDDAPRPVEIVAEPIPIMRAFRVLREMQRRGPHAAKRVGQVPELTWAGAK